MTISFSRVHYAIPKYFSFCWWPKLKMLRLYHWVIEVHYDRS